MIAGLRRAGTTVLLTSHYLDEVQRLANRVGVLSHGHLVEEATPGTLGGRDVTGTVISFRLPAALASTALPYGGTGASSSTFRTAPARHPGRQPRAAPRRAGRPRLADKAEGDLPDSSQRGQLPFAA